MLLSILLIIIDLDDNYGLLVIYNGEALSETQLSSDNGIYSITVSNGVSALEEVKICGGFGCLQYYFQLVGLAYINMLIIIGEKGI